MAEKDSYQGGASAGSDPWKNHAYVGYSMICKHPSDMKRVVAVLSEKKNPRATPMVWTEFTGFVFVKPEKSMTVYAFDSWRSRHQLRQLDLIVHASGITSYQDLLSSLRPQNGNPSCKYFLPQHMGGASAGEVLSLASSTSVLLPSTGGASTAVSTPVDDRTIWFPIDSASHRQWFPPSIRRTHFVESLTPLLFGRDELLVSRSRGYEIGEFLGGGTFGGVYKTINPTGETVAVKILHKDAWKQMSDKQRTMREIYILERCSDLLVHIVRVLDVFLDKTHRRMHIVMELWGESLESYRLRQGFDRLASQPTTHIRTLLMHVCRALSYLHRGLGMCHTDVKLDNILIIDKVDCLEKGIECKLADVGSVEEVTALRSPSRAGSRYPRYPTGAVKYVQVDEKPVHMIESGSRAARSLEFAGIPSVSLRTNHSASRERVAIMTSVSSQLRSHRPPRV